MKKDLPQALSMFQASFTELKRGNSKDDLGLAAQLVTAAGVADKVGDIQQGLEWNREALGLFVKVGVPLFMVISLINTKLFFVRRFNCGVI
jgi:hypothetical protein